MKVGKDVQEKVVSWKDDKVKIRFHNLERKGERHTFSVNGELFHLEHGKICVVPRAVVNALNDAVKIEWKIEGEKEKEPVSFEDKRFLCEMIVEETKTEAEKKEDDILSGIVNMKQGSDNDVERDI